LAQGKTPYSIGKELSAWIEKLFETSIPAETIRTQARRAKGTLRSNDQGQTTFQNHSEIPDNQVCEHGGIREGAGRPAKYAPEPKPWSCAMQGRGKITS
jgi:hypothetical protein